MLHCRAGCYPQRSGSSHDLRTSAAHSAPLSAKLPAWSPDFPLLLPRIGPHCLPFPAFPADHSDRSLPSPLPEPLPGYISAALPEMLQSGWPRPRDPTAEYRPRRWLLCPPWQKHLSPFPLPEPLPCPGHREAPAASQPPPLFARGWSGSAPGNNFLRFPDSPNPEIFAHYIRNPPDSAAPDHKPPASPALRQGAAPLSDPGSTDLGLADPGLADLDLTDPGSTDLSLVDLNPTDPGSTDLSLAGLGLADLLPPALHSPPILP